jgi:hypothetical protein
MYEMKSRREFLRNMAETILGAGMASKALPAGRSAKSGNVIPPDLFNYDFFIGRVKFNSEAGENPWNMRPEGEKYLLEEFSKVVQCKVKIPGRGGANAFNAIVDLNYTDGLHKLPFLFMTASGHFSFNDTQKQNFKNYVEQGGFVFMDDCVSFRLPGDFFYRCSCQLLEHLFGKPALKEVSTGHEIFHNVYDFCRVGIPYMQGKKWPPRGIFIEDRLAVLLTSTDLHCGWVDRSHGWFGGPGIRRNFGSGTHGYSEAIKMGINLIMYVLSH